jgi:hypothetical protein
MQSQTGHDTQHNANDNYFVFVKCLDSKKL